MKRPGKDIIESIVRLKGNKDFDTIVAWLNDSWEMAATAADAPPRAEDVPVHFMALGRKIQLEELVFYIERAEHLRLEDKVKSKSPMKTIFG